MKESCLEILNDFINRNPKLTECRTSITDAVELLTSMYLNGGKLLLAGNGGSACDADHVTGELMKSFVKRRKISVEMIDSLRRTAGEDAEALITHLEGALPAIALPNQIAVSTAYSNDAVAELSFAQQVNGLGMQKDIFLGITTSGNSKNMIYAFETAKAKGMKTILLSGSKGGKCKGMCDVEIIVPEIETYKIQEMHLPIYHVICLMLEENFF